MVSHLDKIEEDLRVLSRRSQSILPVISLHFMLLGVTAAAPVTALVELFLVSQTYRRYASECSICSQ